jgi:UDP-N-acetylglucosamine 4,6-dehydratase
VGSRGSVIPLFKEQRKNKKVTVTDSHMTRFWIDLEQGVKFVINSIEKMNGGEVFVPKIPSMNIMDLVQAIAPNCEVSITGIRPGEKLHETLVGEDESWHTVELNDMYIIKPLHDWWDSDNWSNGKKLPEGFRYSSNTNDMKLTVDELRKLAS